MLYLVAKDTIIYLIRIVVSLEIIELSIVTLN